MFGVLLSMIVGLSLSRGGRRRDDDARQGHRAVGRCRRGVASVALLTPSKHLVSTIRSLLLRKTHSSFHWHRLVNYHTSCTKIMRNIYHPYTRARPMRV